MKKVMANELDYPSNRVKISKGFNGRYRIPIRTRSQRDSWAEWTGKSSVVDSLRWALIEVLPKVEAINATSQSLINKNAGLANGMPEVIVELAQS